eukprot:scaffold82841_cov63-Cyclotella_meneghiniana.AAC.4
MRLTFTTRLLLIGRRAECAPKWRLQPPDLRHRHYGSGVWLVMRTCTAPYAKAYLLLRSKSVQSPLIARSAQSPSNLSGLWTDFERTILPTSGHYHWILGASGLPLVEPGTCSRFDLALTVLR